ncbi:porin [Noviherbaspirillum pedocola]|uniref:Porin n=1 Tax=Noviherbaspirillum pedocola TaxID=2801341 RepID=A0A934T0L6_9BURK|nr:porin [Noviherbaspirillum pedocola]MBK4738501.1 porin [Noviherbaspirillum pedocola]
MKKSLLALAIALVTGDAAYAQSSLIIYGAFDGGVRYQTNQDAAGHTKLTLSSIGTYNANRIGFKGVEDLGGGLNAHFNLESGFNTGTGALDNSAKLFNRVALVGLGSQWGSLDLGRQYTAVFKTIGGYDPFNYKYTNIIPLTGGASAGIRYDNDLQYTGTFGPITARAEWALGEQTGSARNSSAQGVGVSYFNGSINVGAAYALRKPNVAAAGASANFQENRTWTLGGAYTFGPARIAGGYQRENQDLVSGSTQQRNAWFGGSYDFSPAFAVTAAYYDTKVDNISNTGTNGKRQLLIAGTTYALSKRTNLYADIDYARFRDGLALPVGAAGLPAGNFLAGGSSQLGLASAAGQSHQTGVSVGINHLF